MDPRFLEDLRQQAADLSEEARPFLQHQLSASDRKTVPGLRRTALQTYLTGLLMDAVAWLNTGDPTRPEQRAFRLKSRVKPGAFQDVAAHDPALGDLNRRVERLYVRLERIERQLDTGRPERPGQASYHGDLPMPAFDTPIYV